MKRRTRHGARRRDYPTPPEYWVWQGMHQRCRDPHHATYKIYGGRGIFVCERWSGKNGYANFIADMKPRPSSDPSLHRKDGNGPYSPENCEWATIKIQSRHKRSTKLTAEIVAEIRRRDYIPARDFARTYKVDIKTVERVRSKKAWR